MKQTLKIGDTVKVINKNDHYYKDIGVIVDKAKNWNWIVEFDEVYLGDNVGFYDESELQLIKPKTKKVKKWQPSFDEPFYYVTNTGEIDWCNFHPDRIDSWKLMTGNFFPYTEEGKWKASEYREKLLKLATQPQPIKQQSKKIEKLEVRQIVISRSSTKLNTIDDPVYLKINEIIDYINSKETK